MTSDIKKYKITSKIILINKINTNIIKVHYFCEKITGENM